MLFKSLSVLTSIHSQSNQDLFSLVTRLFCISVKHYASTGGSPQSVEIIIRQCRHSTTDGNVTKFDALR